MDDWELAKEKQREEVVTAIAEAENLHSSFKLQMDGAREASFKIHMAEALDSSLKLQMEEAEDLYSREIDDSAYTAPLLADLERLDKESEDRLFAQTEMIKAKGDIDLILNDIHKVNSLRNNPRAIKKCQMKRFPLGESSATPQSQTFRIYSKALLSNEVVKNDNVNLGGFGVSICDSLDIPRLEMNKALRDEELAHPHAELAAIIHALKWALELGLAKVICFCDDSSILDYVTGKIQSSESSISTLVEQVTLLQSRFLHCQSQYVRKDINSVIKLARDAIASQTRWFENNVEVETCCFCFNYIQSLEMYEVRHCFHRICRDCMSNHIRYTLERGDGTVECPIEKCKVELIAEDCRSIADQEKIDLMIHRQRELNINVVDRVYCPNPNCSYLMSQGPLLKASRHVFADAEQSGARKCESCAFCFCINCKDKWHYGMNCENFRKTSSYKASHQADFQDAAQRCGWKKCPHCDTMVERADGCKRMTCRYCHCEFCYTCGTEWVMKKPKCKCPFRVQEG